MGDNPAFLILRWQALTTRNGLRDLVVGHKIDIVVLRRDLAFVLKSFVELGYFSPRNPLSFEWMSSPNAATAALASAVKVSASVAVS